MNARPKLASESYPAREATSAIDAVPDLNTAVALLIRHRVTEESGDSPTSALKRVAKVVRDIATLRARLLRSQRASGSRWMDRRAAPIRGSRSAAANPNREVSGAEKYVRSTSMNNRSARRVTASSAPGRPASASSARNASVSPSQFSTPRVRPLKWMIGGREATMGLVEPSSKWNPPQMSTVTAPPPPARNVPRASMPLPAINSSNRVAGDEGESRTVCVWPPGRITRSPSASANRPSRPWTSKQQLPCVTMWKDTNSRPVTEKPQGALSSDRQNRAPRKPPPAGSRSPHPAESNP